jgi:hypothetical protein
MRRQRQHNRLVIRLQIKGIRDGNDDLRCDRVRVLYLADDICEPRIQSLTRRQSYLHLDAIGRPYDLEVVRPLTHNFTCTHTDMSVTYVATGRHRVNVVGSSRWG